MDENNNNNNMNFNRGKVIDVKIEELSRKVRKVVIPALIVILLVFLASKSFYTLDTKENAVILRLGRFKQVETNAGLHFVVPLIDKVKIVNVEKIHNMEYGFRTLEYGTVNSEPGYGDQNTEANVIVDGANNNASIALIEVIIQYKVKDPFNYLFKVDDVEGTLRLALEDVIRMTVQAFTLDEVKTRKEDIDKEILPLLQRKIDEYDTGLEIVLVGTQNVQFLDSVESAYQQKENANQYKNGKIEDGEKYENTVVPQAKAEARKIVEEANAYSATVKAEAKAGVASFLALYDEYKNNPQILKERYYLEAMNEFVRNNKVIIDMTEQSDYLKHFDLGKEQ